MVDRERPGDVPLGVEREVARRRCASSAGRPTSAARAIAERPSHCCVRACSERRAPATGVSASVDEPTRTSTLRRAPARSTALLQPLAVDARASPMEALRAALRRSACRSSRTCRRSLPRCAASAPSIDGQDVLRVLLERVVDLAVERLGRRLGEVVVGRLVVASRPRSSRGSPCAEYSIASTHALPLLLEERHGTGRRRQPRTEV